MADVFVQNGDKGKTPCNKFLAVLSATKAFKKLEFIPLHGNHAFYIHVKKCSEVHLTLFGDLKENDEAYEIIVSGGPQGKVSIKEKGINSDASEILELDILQYDSFIIRFNGGYRDWLQRYGGSLSITSNF